MNCLWIILLLSCFGGCGCNCGTGCGRDNNGCGGCGRDRQKRRCRNAVEKAVGECGSERAVLKTLKERDNDCGCSAEKQECAEAREERAERHMGNNSCDVPGMMPPHWKDFPEVSRSSSHDGCDCEA